MRFPGMALAFLVLNFPLFSQNADGANGSTKQVTVAPSDTIKYPKESDILNKTTGKTPAPNTPASTFSEGYTPDSGKLLAGWYLQVLDGDSEDSAKSQAEKLRVALPGQNVYIQKLEKGWRILTGPLAPTAIEKSLKAAQALGLTAPTLHRE